MTEQDFEALIARGYETNGVEFKGPEIRTSKPFFAKVVRAMLGMANRRDGGFVIIGVESVNLEPVGLSDEQAASWQSYDDLSSSANEYASPSINFDLEPFTYRGKKLVIIRVEEFQEIPVLCCKQYGVAGQSPPILRRGACYVRARHKPETSEIPTEEEMRELLELAVDKGVKKFVTRAQHAGLFTIVGALDLPDDEKSFGDQLEELE